MTKATNGAKQKVDPLAGPGPREFCTPDGELNGASAPPIRVPVPDDATDVVVSSDQHGALRMHWHGGGAFQWKYEYTPGAHTIADRTEICCIQVVEADGITGPMDLDAIMEGIRGYIGLCDGRPLVPRP